MAIAADQVLAVMRRPRLARTPGSTAALQGVAHLRGASTPVFDLAALLGDGAGAAAGRLVLVERLGPVGLLADGVEGLQDDAGVESLDLARLLPSPGRREDDATPPPAAASAAGEGAACSLISFTMEGRAYAVPLAALRDVIPLGSGQDGRPASPGTKRDVPGAVDHAPPRLAWRDLHVPLVAGAGLLHAGASSRAARALVLEGPAGLVALAVDAVGEVLRPDVDALQPAPPRLRGRAVTHLLQAQDGGLTAVLDPQRLLDGAPAVAARRATAVIAQACETLVLFEIAGGRFAAPAATVETVTSRAQGLARAPGAGAGVRGVAYRGGQASPVLDACGGRWTLWLTLGGVKLGLDVDAPPRTLAVEPGQLSQRLGSPVFDRSVTLADGAAAPVLARRPPPRLPVLAEALGEARAA